MAAVDEIRLWGIHAQSDRLFLENGIIAIGWKEMGDLSLIEPTREAFKKSYARVYPNEKRGSIATSAGMLFRFCNEVKPGDRVIFPSRSDRMVNIGVIDGDYVYDPTMRKTVQTRAVKWLKHLPRTAFSQGALYEIGSAMSFFMVKNYADEFIASLDYKSGRELAHETEYESIAAAADEILESTRDFILRELCRRFKGHELEELAADLLNAMGYRTSLSAHGGDSGIDIVAYRDELPPRILVQVKSSRCDIKESTIQSLKGAMLEGDYGLFITLSDYTKNAKNYLKNTPMIRGINGTELVDLILKYYKSMSERFKRLIPLKTVYIPVSTDRQ